MLASNDFVLHYSDFMQLIRGLYNLKTELINGCVATIGNYDGVHLGHQEIIDFVKKKSLELRLPSVVVVFEPQPEEFFTGDKSQRLTSIREKIVLLEHYGIDKVLLLAFNAHLATISASQFIKKILVDSLQVRHLVVGDDFVFGHRCEGNFSLLEQEAANSRFHVTKMPSFKIDGVRVSSSLIRAALASGNFDLAAKFLGRIYGVSGRVVHGSHIGRGLGFPTANIYLRCRELPFTGVYLVKVYGLVGGPLSGMVNVGFRPTVSGKQKAFEVYILDFASNIYRRRVTVEFLKKIREEQKFGSLMELKLQIEKDLVTVRALLK
jgi:riboflavin kinase / FMN adenylyltransferase